MIVRDLDDAWQIVLQTDHAVLAGDFARAWGNSRFARPEPFESVVHATARHDDGWAVWERAPSLFAENDDVRPRNFLDVQVQLHLAFYRAMIASVADDDPYAGLLVSMHGRGIYNGRHGTDPELKLTFAPLEQEAVARFAAEQDELQREMIDRVGVQEEERWTNYKLLQLFDRLSLYFCMKDLEHGEPDVIAPAPTDYQGHETSLDIRPAGPWSVTIDPYPFTEPVAHFRLPRRVIAKKHCADLGEFRNAFFAELPEQTKLTVRPR